MAENSVITVTAYLRTLRRTFRLAVEWGKLDHSPAIHELPQPKGRDRVVSFEEVAKYLAKASENLRDTAILAVDTGLPPNSELFPSNGSMWTWRRAQNALTVSSTFAKARRRVRRGAFPSPRVPQTFYSAAS